MRKYSEACEQNKDPILEILKLVFNDVKSVLEIASGTGQHAVYFAKHLQHITWQPSELNENLASIRSWSQGASLINLLPVIELNINHQPWPITQTDAIFIANSFHIVSLGTVNNFFTQASKIITRHGKLAVYGPFSYGGKHISQSNQDFDEYLQGRDPLSGIKDFDVINEIANTQNLVFLHDYRMPVNNRLLVWQKA